MALTLDQLNTASLDQALQWLDGVYEHSPWIAQTALQRFLDHIQRHEGVWVARRIDIARHWKATHPYPG